MIVWKKEVSLGNIISAATVLVSVTIFILSIRYGNQVEMTELRGEMKVYSASLDALKRDFNDFKSSSQQSNIEVRQKLDSVSGMIGDMRVLVAGKLK